MPTRREREYYRMGFRDGMRAPSIQEYGATIETMKGFDPFQEDLLRQRAPQSFKPRKIKRKLSAWNKFVKANSKKSEFRYRDGKLNLKKMGVAFRRKKRR